MFPHCTALYHRLHSRLPTCLSFPMHRRNSLSRLPPQESSLIFAHYLFNSATSTIYPIPLQYDESRLRKSRVINVLVHNSIFERTFRTLSVSSITSMLSLFGVQPSPTQQRKRLCRLLSSVVYFSTTQEDCEYRVHQPFGSWDTFVIPIVILISIGMLALYHTARGVCGRQEHLFTRSWNVLQTAFSMVQALMSPGVLSLGIQRISGLNGNKHYLSYESFMHIVLDMKPSLNYNFDIYFQQLWDSDPPNGGLVTSLAWPARSGVHHFEQILYYALLVLRWRQAIARWKADGE